MKNLCGARLVAARALERFEQVSLLKVFVVRDEVESFFGKLEGRRGDARGVVVCDRLRERLGLYGVGAFERDGALDRVL